MEWELESDYSEPEFKGESFLANQEPDFLAWENDDASYEPLDSDDSCKGERSTFKFYGCFSKYCREKHADRVIGY